MDSFRLLPHRIEVLLTLLFLAGVISGSANTPTEADLAFRSQLGRAVLVQEQRYAEELTKLEKRYASERRYQDATIAKTERLKTEARIKAIKENESTATTAPTEQINAKTFRPVIAKLEGAVSYDDSENAILLTGSDDCLARWDLDGFTPGGYTVRLTYTSTAPDAKIELSEEFFMLKKSLPTTKEGAIKTIDLGTLRIRSGNGPLTACALGITPGSPIFIRSIELLPNPQS